MKFVRFFDILLRYVMLFGGLLLLIGCSKNGEIKPMTIQKLIDCWKTSDPSYTWNPPATEAEIRAAEENIGFTLPSSLRELYGFFNGGEDIFGGLFFYPLESTPDELGLTDATEMYIQWQWYNPREVLLFAHEGASNVYGIWLPETDSEVFRQPIIEVGSIHEEGCMGVVGTNLESFLLSLTAAHLIDLEIEALHDDGENPNAVMQLKRVQTALDMLKVPQRLRRKGLTIIAAVNDPSILLDDEQDFVKIRKWADPLIPDSLLANPYYSSYSQRYTVTDLKKLFGESKDN